MPIKITVRYLTRDVTTWQSPQFVAADFDSDDTTPDNILRGRVFRCMNAVDGDPDFEICVRLRVRSMMVGDEVVIDRSDCKVLDVDPAGEITASHGRRKVYKVEPTGWSEVQ